jgi:SNF2 family DNA or RNA helicase
MWRFPLDFSIWEKFEKEFESYFKEGKVKKDLSFIVAMNKRKESLNKFIKFKEIAEKDEPTDFGVEGVSLNGKNCLFNYQRHGVQCGLQVGDGFLIGDVPGLGKSVQSIAIAVERKNRGEIRNCLIVCPASLKYNWLDEIHKFTKEKALVIGHKAKNKEDREKQWIAEGYFFKIVNYELVARDLYCEPKKADNRISCANVVLKSYDMCIWDEIQYLKHHSSIRTQACRAIQTKYRIGLSGTPIDGKLEEIHSIFQILKPGLFVNKTQFMARYAEYDYFGSVKGYHHVQEVRDKISPYYIRRLKETVFKDLPPKLYTDLHVELSTKNMSDYKKIIKGKSEVTSESSAAELMLRARQFLDFPEIVGLHNSSDKYKVFKELIDSLVGENKEKVIVFSQYTNTINYIIKNLKADGYNDILLIDGSVGSEERQEICRKFNGDDKPYILIMSDAGATGLNLQTAKSVIHYTDSFSPATMLQRNDRAHRATTRHTVNIYRFICDGTIDEHVRNILGKKSIVNNAMLDENCSEFEMAGLTALELLTCL